MSAYHLPCWPFVYGQTCGTGHIRQRPEDFIVHEHLAFTPSGSGEHVFLYLEKTSENTEFIAQQLAKFAQVNERDVGYAGLKDRHAITRQWFSIWLPGGRAEPDWCALNSPHLNLLDCQRHARKLKRGALTGNQFSIIIREWQGDNTALLAKLAQLKAQGMANYYGEQRFGHQGLNLTKAVAMFKGKRVNRNQRSLYLSSARSFLFNHILAQRIQDKTWNQALTGDAFCLHGSRSWFKAIPAETNLNQRLADYDIHPTGVLWGIGAPAVSADTAALEQGIIDNYPELNEGLCAAGVTADRRSLRVMIPDLCWEFTDDTSIRLNFTLPAGSFATALLRELFALS